MSTAHDHRSSAATARRRRSRAASPAPQRTTSTSAPASRPRQGARPQDLPRPLVVHARRGRALQLHRHPALGNVPDVLLRGVDGRGPLRGLLRAAQGHRDVGGYRVDARHLLRHPRRPARCARSTTGRRCCSWPPSACTCSACSSRARSASRASSTGSSASCCSSSPWPRASPATRSPTTCSPATVCASSTAWSRASRSSAPGSRTCCSVASSPASTIVGRLYIAAHPAAAGDHPRAHRRAPAAARVNKHTQFAGPGRTNDNVVGFPDHAGLRGQGRWILLHRLRRDRADRVDVHDQPDLELRTVRPLPGLGGYPARLVHRLRRRRAATRAAGLGVRAGSASRGRSTSSLRW